MGLGFYLTGEFGDEGDGPETWLARLAAWFDDKGGEPLESVRVGEDDEGCPGVFVRLHPCAEDIEIILPAPGRFVASGRTSTVGPGYHTYACDLLRRLGDEFAIAWDEPDGESGTGDETGYFHTGDRRAVEDEFLRWLRSLATVVAEDLDEHDEGIMISMPLRHRYPGHGPLITPLGPRDRGWVQAVLDDPGRGTDLFPWWDEGLSARYYLGRALCRMWTDVRWRAPLTDSEAELLLTTNDNLCRAFERDPTLSFPCREWREMRGYLSDCDGFVEMLDEDAEDEVARRASETVDGPRIGYRRSNVRLDLTGRWSIEIPGSLAEEWDDEGGWCSWDSERTVWFSSFTFVKPDGSEPTAEETLAELPLPGGERLEYRGERVTGLAVFAPCEDDGKRQWRLCGHSAVVGGLGVCNIFLTNPDDRDWAVSVWQSLDHS